MQNKKHWAKEVVQRTKRRDDPTNSRFVQKKINHFMRQYCSSSCYYFRSTNSIKYILVTIDDRGPCTETSPSNCRTCISNMIIDRTGLSIATTQVGSEPTTLPARETTTTSTSCYHYSVTKS